MRAQLKFGLRILAAAILPFFVSGCSTEPIGRWLMDSGIGGIILLIFGILLVGGILHQIFAKGNVAAALVVIAIIVVIVYLVNI